MFVCGNVDVNDALAAKRELAGLLLLGELTHSPAVHIWLDLKHRVFVWLSNCSQSRNFVVSV